MSERCSRNPRCNKGAGHAGWCRTKAEHETGRSQDDLFASGAGVKRSRHGTGASKIAAMQELGRKREAKQSKRRSGRLPSDDEDDEDYDDDDGDGDDNWGGSTTTRRSSRADEDGVEYTDFGLSRNERKALRGGRSAAIVDDDDEEEETGWSGPPASLTDLESIRLRRQFLEKWLLEPFFKPLVPGCFIRIGLQIGVPGGSMATLYRVAEVVAVQDRLEHPYTFAGQLTCHYLLLDFGDSREAYPMASISNGSFEELELVSWQQVRRVAGLPMVTAEQVRTKSEALQHAHNYQYSEAEITRKVQQTLSQKAAQKGGSATLTTRQKLLAQHGGAAVGGAAPSDLVAKPMKFQRNVFGQAIIEQSDA